MDINDRLEQCKIENHTIESIENWHKHDPMTVPPSVPKNMEDGIIYKCWIYYDDGWGCNYAKICKYEKLDEDGEI